MISQDCGLSRLHGESTEDHTSWCSKTAYSNTFIVATFQRACRKLACWKELLLDFSFSSLIWGDPLWVMEEGYINKYRCVCQCGDQRSPP